MTKKLRKYASQSTLMDMKVIWESEVYTFNLYEEIQINEDSITKEAVLQPSSYAFLTMLHRKLIRKQGELETELKRLYASLYIEKKSRTNNSTGRPYSEEHVKLEILNESQYKLLEDRLFKIKYKAEDIEACIRAFEQRYSLIQTIAANQRKERV